MIKKESIEEIFQALNNLKNDEGLPKNIRAEIDNILGTLNDEGDISSGVGKSLQILDNISEDLNIQPFIRNQIWSISSMLEKLNH